MFRIRSRASHSIVTRAIRCFIVEAAFSKFKLAKLRRLSRSKNIIIASSCFKRLFIDIKRYYAIKKIQRRQL